MLRQSICLACAALVATLPVNAAPPPVIGPEAEPIIIQIVDGFATRYRTAPNGMAGYTCGRRGSDMTHGLYLYGVPQLLGASGLGA
ncbi:MAG TPA: hypothetical protein VKQ27_00520 [Acetobacteraceae bacterium]|nr:hypothetical protein [Acetobacteraceae bacterium]